MANAGEQFSFIIICSNNATSSIYLTHLDLIERILKKEEKWKPAVCFLKASGILLVPLFTEQIKLLFL